MKRTLYRKLVQYFFRLIFAVVVVHDETDSKDKGMPMDLIEAMLENKKQIGRYHFYTFELSEV